MVAVGWRLMGILVGFWAGEWRGCGLVAGLQCGFMFRWDWLFVGLWFVGSVGGGGCTGLLVGVGCVGVWGICGRLFWY